MSNQQQHRLFFDRQLVEGFGKLVGHFPAEQFQSPTRSTLPLLALLKDGTCQLDSLLAEMGLDANADLHVEYQVEPGRGRGKPSHTDLKAKSPNAVVAVEAKWTEPPYENVSSWLKKGGEKPENRALVLQGWIDMIQPWAAKPILADDLGDMTYQTVHRAASACATASASGNAKPRLAYVVFHLPGDPFQVGPESNLANLERFYDLLGRPPEFPFFLFDVEMTPTPAFERIAGLAKGRTETAEIVRQALLNEQLFAFGYVRMVRWSSFSSGPSKSCVK